MVDAQSRAVEKFEISEEFDARAAMSAARCEMDLSPGSRSLPRIEFAGASLIFGSVGLETYKSACGISNPSRKRTVPPGGIPPTTNVEQG